MKLICSERVREYCCDLLPLTMGRPAVFGLVICFFYFVKVPGMI